MHAATKSGQHLAGIVGGAGLSEDFAVDQDGSVGRDHDGRAYGACGHQFGFRVGEALHQILSGFAGNTSFIYGGGHYGEGEASVAEDFGASRGRGGEDEFRGGHGAGRILHASRGNSLGFGSGDGRFGTVVLIVPRSVGLLERSDHGIRTPARAGAPALVQMTTDSWYSPNVRRSVSEISPTVARDSTAVRMAGSRFSVVAVRRDSSVRATWTCVALRLARKDCRRAIWVRSICGSMRKVDIVRSSSVVNSFTPTTIWSWRSTARWYS